MLNTNQFTYTSKTKKLVTELSGLQAQSGFVLDLFISIQSERTGKEMTFINTDIKLHEDEIVCWIFRPKTEKVDLTVTIFND